MADFITVYEVFDVTELQLIKSAFHSNEIDYHILDEFTLTTANTAAMGFVGARIQVPQHQRTEAIDLLIELGYKKPFEKETLSPLLERFRDITDHFPIINYWILPYRIVFVLFAAVAMLFWWLWMQSK